MDDFVTDIENCLHVLHRGGIILYPTDTVWGLGCDATNEDAVNRIYQIKKRDDSKALIVLVASEREVLRYTAGVDLSLFDYLSEAPVPTTVIYENAIGFAQNLVAEDGSIAIRICRDAFCKTLIKRLGRPLVSTSANISGIPTPTQFDQISNEIKKAVDYMVLFRQNDKVHHQASSIIRWTNGVIEKIR